MSLQTLHHSLSLAAKCSLGLTLSCEVHIWMSYIAHVTEGTGEFHSNSGVTCDTATCSGVTCDGSHVTSAVRSQAQNNYRIAGNFCGVQISFFLFSVYQNENLRRNVCYDGCVFLCKMDRMKIKRTNQLKIAQNEIWTPRKFPAIPYLKIHNKSNFWGRETKFQPLLKLIENRKISTMTMLKLIDEAHSICT